jgi:hypothetical protein
MSQQHFVTVVENTFRQVASRVGGQFGEGVGAVRGCFDAFWDFVDREREKLDTWQSWGIMGHRYGLTWYLILLRPSSDPVDDEEVLLSMFVECGSSAMVRFTGTLDDKAHVERPAPAQMVEKLEREGFRIQLSVWGVRVWAPSERAKSLFDDVPTSVDRLERLIDTALELTREMAEAEGDRFV